MQNPESEQIAEIRLRVMLKNEIRNLQMDLDNAQTEVSNLQDRLIEASSVIREQSDELVRVTAALTGVVESTSWRMTSLLRKSKSFILRGD
jgi:chromosome segregation ATPase